MTHPHEDPVGESRREVLLAAAALITPVEALARLYAANKSRQADGDNAAAARDRAAARVDGQAAQLAEAVQAERRRLAERIDGSWLKEATFAEAAQAWRTATAWAANGDAVGSKVAGMALDRLGELDPQWRAAYDRHRAAGMSGWEAVRAAAYEKAERDLRDAGSAAPRARAHPGRGAQPALEPGGLRAAADDFEALTGAAAIDAAVRAEVRTLAAHLSPEAIRAFQQHLRNIDRVPPVGDLELLHTFAAEAAKAMPVHQELAAGEDLRLWTEAKAASDRATQHEARAADDAGTPDDQQTVADEHVQGLQQAGAETGRAEHDRATAAHLRTGLRVAPAAFPVKLIVRSKVPPAVAEKRPAQVQTRVKGQGR